MLLWNKKDEDVSVYGNVKTNRTVTPQNIIRLQRSRNAMTSNMGWLISQATVPPPNILKRKHSGKYKGEMINGPIELRYYTSYFSLQSNSQVNSLEATFILQT